MPVSKRDSNRYFLICQPSLQYWWARLLRSIPTTAISLNTVESLIESRIFPIDSKWHQLFKPLRSMAKNLRPATSNEYAEKFEIFAAFRKT